jgi:iron complex transport system substrate-binding protein
MDNPSKIVMTDRKRKIGLIITVLAILIISGIVWYTLPPITVKLPTLPLTLTDDFGRNVVIPEIPERIVSLSPSNTEILFALGLGPKVIGVTKFCDYPPEVLQRVKEGDIAVIGGFVDPSIERIVALNPDLVLVATRLQEKVVNELEKMGLTVLALDPHNVGQILADIKLVGKACGKSEEAEKLANEMKQVIDFIFSKTKNVPNRPRVYYEVWYEPLYTIGPGTWQNELIEIAGGVNIFADAKQAYPIVSSEAVIQRDPEIIIVPVGYMGGVKKEDFEKRPGWSAVSAVENDRIHEIDENLVIRPGPRIVRGLERLAGFIHPEIFGASSAYSQEGLLITCYAIHEFSAKPCTISDRMNVMVMGIHEVCASKRGVSP